MGRMTGPPPLLPPSLRPLRIAIAGLVALAVAMGIGRFAFTPLLPLMMADGSVDLAAAGWLASANYFGYLVGALLCTFQPWLWSRLGWRSHLNAPRMVRAGLVATVLLTLGMALPWTGVWPSMRFAAGVASAFVFIYTSGWCLGQLARLRLPEMGALIYTGPGMGIMASGFAASGLVAAGGTAAAGWLLFGALAAVLTAGVWSVFHPSADLPAAAGAVKTTGAEPLPAGAGPAGIALFALAYALAGFGYIMTATFLPVIARQALPASPWVDQFWPLFGLGVVAGALLASRIRRPGDLRWMLVACYVVQSLGVAASLLSPTLAGFALGSLALGLPFTAITFFAMQEVRRLRPQQAASYMGLLTAMYGLGQIVGPPLAAALVARAATPAEGFNLSLTIAAAALAAGAALYALVARLYPVNASPAAAAGR
jgi:MFS family permease